MDSVEALRGHVEDATFRRGLYYAEHGAVLTVHRIGADRISGSVRGNSPKPYDVELRLEVGDGRVARFSGDCTCPVGLTCKHAVALAIVALRRERDNAGSGWTSALAPLFDEPPAQETPPLALQFDLRNADVPGSASIDLRPVVPGKNSAWVRTGVSWTSLTRTYYRWETPGSRESSPRFKAAAQLLGEILAMSGRGGYAPSGAPVRLQDVPTRRIWLLLAEAAREGVPLIGAGRSAPAVRLADPAELGLDICAEDGDLLLTPRVTLDGGDIQADGIRLLGETPHGVAWWTDERKKPRLTLAPLAGALDEVVAAVVARGSLRIPEADAEEFTTRYLPRLQRRVTIGSVDRSFAVRPPEPPLLVLRVSQVTSGGLRLGWVWRQQGSELALHPETPGPDRDPAFEAGLLDTVAELARDSPPVFDADGGLLADTTLFGYDAVRFRSETLPRLEAAAGVEVEIDPTIPDYREALSHPLVKATAQPKDDDWYDLAVSVDVDGDKVPFELLFLALAQGRSHLLLPSGTWFPLNTPELSALAMLIVESQLLGEPDRKPLTVSRYRPDTWADLVFLGVIDAQAAEWRSRMLTVDGPAEPAPVPDTVRAALRPYQVEGFRWLAERADRGLGGVLADEMGLGKTLQAITLMCHRQGPGQRFLVVAPTRRRAQLAAELERFAPHLAVTAVEETARRRGVSWAQAIAASDVVVTSYALLRLEFDDYAAQQWSVLFLDEAQFVKNRHSLSYDCAKRLPAAVKIAMTGTPMENNLMELWSMFSLVAPGLFPEASHFEHHYGATIARGSEERLLKLRSRIAPFLLRRTKAEVAVELPERQEQVLELRLNAEHHRGYQLLLQRERQKVLKLLADDGMRKNRLQVLRSLTRLRLAALDLGLVGTSQAPSTKLERLVELVTEIAGENHRVLIFSQFTSFLRMARERLEAAGIGCSYLDGSTTGRGEVVERFRTGVTPAFLISLKAGGFGLNLVEADYVILLDPWWNPATEAQAIDRAHRIGQTRSVMVYRLIAEDTIEAKVVALAARKAELFASVLAGGDGIPTALDAEDIRALLRPVIEENSDVEVPADNVPDPVEMCRVAEIALTPILGPVALTPVATLRGSPRSQVIRAIGNDAEGRKHRFVLKQTVAPVSEGDSAPMRERAALETLARARTPHTVRLLASADDPQLLVLEDLGDRPGLADLLLGDDANAAATAVERWAVSLAATQAATRELREPFAIALGSSAGDVDASMEDILTAVPVLEELLPKLGVTIHNSAMAELAAIPELLHVSGATQAGALSPADTCPDNNSYDGEAFTFLDYEGATFRHVAWDASYLTVPWPSCWCCWRLPDEIGERALSAWREALPGVPDCDRSVALARIGWAFVTASWFLPAALAGDPRPTDSRLVAPTRKAMLQHRMATVGDAGLPALQALAARMAEAMERQWGLQPLPLAPAFR